MRLAVSLTIPQPCHQSWAAMTPVAAGRHCAACAKTVVDFTQQTDAEILAYLAGAASNRTCGRFAAGQLERPLQRAVPAVPTARWRAWLAVAVAVWAMREGVGEPVKAQAASAEWRARYGGGGPAPAAEPLATPASADEILPLEMRKPLASIALPAVAHRTITMGAVSSQRMKPLVACPQAALLIVRGVITDFSTKEALPGVTVLLKGTTIGASTRADGTFEFPIAPQLAEAASMSLTVSAVGYVTQERQLATKAAGEVHRFQLQADVKGMMGEVVVCRLPPSKLPPAPWHPRRFYYWGKYWLTRPFRGS